MLFPFHLVLITHPSDFIGAFLYSPNSRVSVKYSWASSNFSFIDIIVTGADKFERLFD